MTYPVEMPSLFAVAGILGFALYLAAFAGLQLGWMQGGRPAYTILNILAAALVLVSLSEAFNLASALIQVSWIVIGCVGLLRTLRLVRQEAPAAERVEPIVPPPGGSLRPARFPRTATAR